MGDPVLKVVDGALGNLGEGLLGEEGLVAADDHVGERHETHQHVVLDDVRGVVVVKELTLGLVHVEREASDVVGLERLDDGLGVDEASSRRVDQHGVLLHQRKALGVDDVACLVHEGTVEADNVALGEKVLEVAVLAILLKGGRWEGIIGEEGAAEALHDAGGSKTNLANTDDADRLAAQRLTEKTVESKVALTDTVVGAVCLAVEGLNQSDSKLGNSLGRVRGYVGDHDAHALGSVKIDIVEAGASEEDSLDAKLGQSGDDIVVDNIVDKDADSVGTLDQRHRVLVEGELVEHKLDARRRVLLTGDDGRQVLFVVGLCAKDGDLHFDDDVSRKQG